MVLRHGIVTTSKCYTSGLQDQTQDHVLLWKRITVTRFWHWEQKYVHWRKVYSKPVIIDASRGKEHLTGTVIPGRNYSNKMASITATRYTFKE